MLTYKDAKLFDTATRVIFDWHFCVLLTNVIVEALFAYLQRICSSESDNHEN